MLYSPVYRGRGRVHRNACYLPRYFRSMTFPTSTSLFHSGWWRAGLAFAYRSTWVSGTQRFRGGWITLHSGRVAAALRR